MKRTLAVGLAALLGFASPLAQAPSAQGTWDGPVAIQPKQLDAAFLRAGAATLSQRLTPEEVDNIAKAACAGIIDLDVTAPDYLASGRSRTHTMESGQATLFLEVRDSPRIA